MLVKAVQWLNDCVCKFLFAYFLKPAPLGPLMSRFCARLARLASRSPLRRLCELAELGTGVVEMIGTAGVAVVVDDNDDDGGPAPSEDTFIGCRTSPNASNPAIVKK